ncbi:MAG: hypothetical protein Q8M11_11525 [Sulfuritalea sp.]|nr:hypothetical protein [Sulfuritalea sp.]MDP1982366.1 hypothetical protein [Sulfuritalea sp.]
MGVRKKEEADLCAAVDAFAADMKAKLVSKARQGRNGWKRDIDYATAALTRELLSDAAYLVAYPDKPKTAVDVANRAMMLWYRSKGSNVQGNRRCAALSRSVQRPKGARLTAGLGL